MRESRIVLWAGFGGLLLLLAFAGFGTVQELRQIQKRTEEVQGDFIRRDRLLHEIRSNLYLSGRTFAITCSIPTPTTRILTFKT